LGKYVSPLGKSLGLQNIVLEIQQYQGKWLQHCDRMDTNSIPKPALKNKQKMEKKHGTPEEKMEGPTST
jgi:hypothetical protein